LADINHRPDFFDSRISSTMRSPSNAVYSNTLTFQSALKKFNNTNGVNTNGMVFPLGGALYYRTTTNGPWSSNNLSLSITNGDFQFVSGSVSNAPVGVVQYYLQFNFDSGARTTYTFYTNNSNGYANTTNQATAQASPYSLTISKATATLTISGTNQTYNGSPRPVSVNTTPSGLTTQVTYNGGLSAPTDPGTYAILASVNDNNYQGSSSASLLLGGIDNPTGDSNGNGLPNLLEYALLDMGSTGTNPNITGGYITQQSVTGTTNSNSTLSLIALVRTNDSRLSYLPQASVDLGSSNWAITGFSTNIPSQTNVPTGFQRREYQFNAGTNPRAFLKLTIQQQ
jgi:hypothetical protein